MSNVAGLSRTQATSHIQHSTLARILSSMLPFQALQARLDLIHVQKQTDPHDERWYCGQNLPGFHLDLSTIA